MRHCALAILTIVSFTGCATASSKNVPSLGPNGIEINFPFPEGWCAGKYDNTPVGKARVGLPLFLKCREIETAARVRLSSRWTTIPTRLKVACVHEAQAEMRALESANADARRLRSTEGYYNAYSLSTLEQCVAKGMKWPVPPTMATIGPDTGATLGAILSAQARVPPQEQCAAVKFAQGEDAFRQCVAIESAAQLNIEASLPTLTQRAVDSCLLQIMTKGFDGTRSYRSSAMRACLH